MSKTIKERLDRMDYLRGFTTRVMRQLEMMQTFIAEDRADDCLEGCLEKMEAECRSIRALIIPKQDKAAPGDASWKLNTPAFLQEIAGNNHMGILKVPLNLFAKMLGAVAERASEINDAKLNSCMARLALYEVCDPYSKEYDSELFKKTLAGQSGFDAAKAVNEHAALEAVAESLFDELAKHFGTKNIRRWWKGKSEALTRQVEALTNLADIREGKAGQP